MRLAPILAGSALPVVAGAATYALRLTLQPDAMPLPSPPLLMALALAVGMLVGPLLAYPATVVGFIAGYLPGFIAHGPYAAGAGLVIITVAAYALVFPVPGVIATALLALYLPPRLRPRGPLGPFRKDSPPASTDDR